MRHRVRAATLILRPTASSQEMLLVKHQSPQTGNVVWLSPGGGLEPEDHSIFDCARREAREESGLVVTVSRIAYVHEFRDSDRQIHHMAFYMVADAISGEVSLDYLPKDATDALVIVEATWLDREAVRSLKVYPEYFQTDAFWQDAAQGFPVTQYLGTMTSM
jgi:8-oxo-dGTP diphosphatase